MAKKSKEAEKPKEKNQDASEVVSSTVTLVWEDVLNLLRGASVVKGAVVIELPKADESDIGTLGEISSFAEGLAEELEDYGDDDDLVDEDLDDEDFDDNEEDFEDDDDE